MPTLRQSIHGNPLPHDDKHAMAQVGWIGQTGNVYGLDDQPYDSREPGGFSPLYIAVGMWTQIGDGGWVIDD